MNREPSPSTHVTRTPASDTLIHPDVAHASTLPAAWYLDAAHLERERERIFWNSWQVVALSHQVANPGDYVAVDLAGEPVVVLRDDKGTLRAMSNVCRHRASVIASGCGNARSLRCPYHSWTYDLKGCLLGAPEFDGVRNWKRESVALPQYAAAQWGPFVLVHLGPNPMPLGDLLGPIAAEIRDAGYPFDDYRFLARTEYDIACNWKVYVDNYLEGYHLPAVHPALFRELDYKEYRVETFGLYSKQFAPLRPVKDGESANRRYQPGEKVQEPLYYWVFPNFMISVYPDNLHTTIVLPTGPGRTTTYFDWFVPPDTTRSLEQTMAFSDVVQKEDMAICEKVQRGLSSRHYDRGRFSARRENGVHHFHQLLAAQLAG